MADTDEQKTDPAIEPVESASVNNAIPERKKINVTIKALPKSELEITGSVDADMLTLAIARATVELSADVELKGFRKGKAPQEMVVAAVGEGRILERAANIALSTVWSEILESHDIDAVGSPSFSITKLARGNPLEWKARVAVMPDITLPSNYLKIANETFSREVKPIDVSDKEIDEAIKWIQKSRAEKDGKLPELDDAFAASLGDFATLASLREHIRKNIADEQTFKERERVRIAALEALRLKSTIEIPEVLLSSEIERMLVDLKQMVSRMSQKWDDYIKNTGKSEDEVRTSMKPDAEKRVAFGLILRAVAKDAHIVPTEEEITERTGKLFAPHVHEDGTAHEGPHDDAERTAEYVRGVLMNEKVFALLEGKNE